MDEKNKYLAIFESLPVPVFLTDQDGFINDMNIIAANYFNTESVPGGLHYKLNSNDAGHDCEVGSQATDVRVHISLLMPWLHHELQDFQEGKLEINPFIKQTTIYNREYRFNVRISAMFDTSHRIDGMILVLEDISKIVATKQEVKMLADLTPIYSH